MEVKPEADWSSIDPEVRATGEAVARLALKMGDDYGQSMHQRLRGAWDLLREACLVVHSTGRAETLDDYVRFKLRPPRELVEASKPPPPEPQREKFDKLFSTGRVSDLKTKTFEGPNENGDPDSFMMKQYSIGDGSDADTRKSSGYKNARKMVEQRVSDWVDENAIRYGLVNAMCRGTDLHEKGDWWGCFITLMDQVTGHCETWANGKQRILFNETVAETPRPTNAGVWQVWSLRRDKNGKLEVEADSGFPGPPPPEGATPEELYETLTQWAELVIERWKKKLAESEFQRFWADAKENGFLWQDVIDLALWSKAHSPPEGIKWRSGYRWSTWDEHKAVMEKSAMDQQRAGEISQDSAQARKNLAQKVAKRKKSKGKKPPKK